MDPILADTDTLSEEELNESIRNAILGFPQVSVAWLESDEGKAAMGEPFALTEFEGVPHIDIDWGTI